MFRAIIIALKFEQTVTGLVIWIVDTCDRFDSLHFMIYPRTTQGVSFSLYRIEIVELSVIWMVMVLAVGWSWSFLIEIDGEKKSGWRLAAIFCGKRRSRNVLFWWFHESFVNLVIVQCRRLKIEIKMTLTIRSLPLVSKFLHLFLELVTADIRDAKFSALLFPRSGPSVWISFGRVLSDQLPEQEYATMDFDRELGRKEFHPSKCKFSVDFLSYPKIWKLVERSNLFLPVVDTLTRVTASGTELEEFERQMLNVEQMSSEKLKKAVYHFYPMFIRTSKEILGTVGYFTHRL